MPKAKLKTKKTKKSVSAFFQKNAGLVFVIVLLVVVVGYFKFVEYQAMQHLEEKMPSEIVDIADKIGMSIEGKYLFYSANPQVVGPDQFAINCNQSEHQGLTRGCVATTSRFGSLTNAQIFLRRLENPIYADAIYDTAAHEMLHIAYKQLSRGSKRRLNDLLDKELKRHRDDPRISLYTEGGNELVLISQEEFYAVLGSYYRDVSSELENYFRRYFRDRDGFLEVAELNPYRLLLDEAAEWKHEAERLSRTSADLSSQLYSNDNLDLAEEDRLTAEYEQVNSQFRAALSKHNEVVRKLDEINSE